MVRFPNTLQEVGSKTCGPSCLHNIYASFGMDKSLSVILHDLGVTDKDSTHLPQLARHLNDNNIETTIISSNPFSVSPSWKNKSKEKIIEKLKKWVLHNYKDSYLRESLFLLFYLQEGGNLEIKDLSTKLIDQCISDGHLVLCCLEESWLWGKRKISGKQEYHDVKGHATGHFVIIIGQTEDEYIVNDPYPTHLPGREGIYNVPKDQLFIATIAWNPQILALKQKG
ncbi:MAG: hypothetical protein U0525_00610 [Patescibacteria group bacterium]